MKSNDSAVATLGLQIEGKKSAATAGCSRKQKYAAIGVGIACGVSASVVLILYISMPYLFWVSSIPIEEYQKHPYGDLLFVRHAFAPGNGDPTGFLIQNCSTQRNLNGDGRVQAGVIGAKLGKLAGETIVFNPRVWTSQWCRCKDTADIIAAKLNSSTAATSSTQALAKSSDSLEGVPAGVYHFYVEEEWGLNSFYQNWGLGFTKSTTTQRLTSAILAKAKADTATRKSTNAKGKLHTILVTHSVVITALTGLRVDSGGVVAYDSTGNVNPIELSL